MPMMTVLTLMMSNLMWCVNAVHETHYFPNPFTLPLFGRLFDPFSSLLKHPTFPPPSSPLADNFVPTSWRV